MSIQPPRRPASSPGLSDVKPELARLDRRLFLRSGLSLGALSLLSGCDATSESAIDRALRAMSRFNDRAQAALFSPTRLAPTFTADRITRPFPFNAYYPESDVRTVDTAAWRLEVGGQVQDRKAWSLDDLRALPQHDQITRHVCVEGWSAIGQWSGPRFGDFLQRVDADLRARYVGFRCFDDYYTSIDMATALHPQTIMALDYGGAPLPPAYGAPMKLRMPTKLGYKNPKYIAALFVTNDYPGGYWEDQGYNWFGGS